MTSARKGDLVVIERTTRDYVIGQPSQVRTDYTFGVVESASRDGVVRSYREVGFGDETLGCARNLRHPDRPLVMPAKLIDVAGVLAAAKANHWPGHPDHPKAFDSLDEARAVAAPFRKESS